MPPKSPGKKAGFLGLEKPPWWSLSLSSKKTFDVHFGPYFLRIWMALATLGPLDFHDIIPKYCSWTWSPQTFQLHSVMLILGDGFPWDVFPPVFLSKATKIDHETWNAADPKPVFFGDYLRSLAHQRSSDNLIGEPQNSRAPNDAAAILVFLKHRSCDQLGVWWSAVLSTGFFNL